MKFQNFFKIVFVLFTLGLNGFVLAKGHSSRSSSSSSGYNSYRSLSYGTGSSSKHNSVSSYTKKDGTNVQSYKRTLKDNTQKNNFTTKKNYNPYTGKEGSKMARY